MASHGGLRNTPTVALKRWERRGIGLYGVSFHVVFVESSGFVPLGVPEDVAVIFQLHRGGFQRVFLFL